MKDLKSRLIGFAVYLAAPATVAIVGSRFVQSRVAIIVGLLIYEAAALAVSILVRILKGVIDQAVSSLTDSINAAIGRKVSLYDKAYRQYVLSSHRFTDARGVPTGNSFTPELEEVYIDVSLTPRALHQISAAVLDRTDVPPERRQSISTVIQRDQSVAIALVAGPGSGKTTLLQYMARAVAKDRRTRRNVAVFLPLRDHAARIVAQPASTLAAIIRDSLSSMLTREPDEWWEHQLSRGCCVVLLDGLDEVPDTVDRSAVSAWVERQIAGNSRNDFVITSRPQGYSSSPINGVRVFHVRPFTSPQVHQFLTAWNRVAERVATGSDGPDIVLRADRATADLLERLNENAALQEFTANPLLLTMIANVHKYRGALPGSRADLYGEVCQVMLWRRHEAKRITGPVSGPVKERLLSSVAFTMMKLRVRDMPRRKMTELVRPVVRRVSTAVSAEDLLGDLLQSGLLVEREHGLLAFSHHTFQEYLAAKHVREKSLEQVLISAVNDPWWAEVSLLYASAGDADPIVEACLTADTVSSLTLAFNCLTTGGELAESLRRRLDSVMDSAFGPFAKPDRQRLVAGILIARNLNSVILTDAGQRMCTSAISCGLYWLFMRLTDSPPPVGSYEIDPLDGGPVAGIWRRDAVRFVNWLNEIGGPSGVLFRLPLASEVQEAAFRARVARQDVDAVWCWCSEAMNVTPELTCIQGDDLRELRGDVIIKAVEADTSHRDLATALTSIALSGFAKSVYALLQQHERGENLPLAETLLKAMLSVFEATYLAENKESVGTPQARMVLHTIQHARRRLKEADTYSRGDYLKAIRTALEQAAALTRTVESMQSGRSGFVQELTDSFVRALAFDSVADTAGGFSGNWHIRQAMSENEVGKLARALGIDSARSRKMVLAIDKSDLDWALDAFMGRTLANFVSSAMRAGPQAKPNLPLRLNELIQALLAAARISPDDVFHVDFDSAGSMPDYVKRRTEIADSFEKSQRILVRAALPFFSRQRPLSQADAVSLRICALAFAGEAYSRGQPRDGDYLRGLAASVTLLRMRVSDASLSPELIYVAQS